MDQDPLSGFCGASESYDLLLSASEESGVNACCLEAKANLIAEASAVIDAAKKKFQKARSELQSSNEELMELKQLGQSRATVISKLKLELSASVKVRHELESQVRELMKTVCRLQEVAKAAKQGLPVFVKLDSVFFRISNPHGIPY